MSRMEPLSIQLETLESGIGLVRLAGRMDIPGVQLVDLKFTVYTATRRKPVIIDLSDVELITSVGIGMLLRNAQTLKLHGQPMILLNPNSKVETVLRLTNVHEVTPVEKELDSAIAYCKMHIAK